MAELDKTISVIESWLKLPVLTPPPINALYDALELLKEQKANTPSAGEIAEEMVNYICEHEKVVRCKDCKHRGNSEKCVLSAISEEKDFPLFILDNRGDWFCADGERR